MAAPWESDEIVKKGKWDNDPVVKTWKERAPAERFNAFSSGTAEGVARLVGLPVDTVTNAVNLAIAGFGTVATAAGKPELAPDLIDPSDVPMSGQRLVDGLRKVGVNVDNPNEWDKWSRALNILGLYVGGSVLPSARSGSVTQAFRPGEAALSSVAGGGAALGTDDPALIGAASMAPVAGAVVKGGTQAVFEKTKTGKTVKDTVGQFRQSGTSPTVGQASQSPFVLAVEDVLSKLPGGHRPFIETLGSQPVDIGKRIAQGSAETAGRTIQKGVKGFETRTSETYSRLDQGLQNAIGDKARIAPSNTLNALDEISGTIAGGKQAGSAITSQTLSRFRDGLLEDISGTGDMPVSALRELRKRIGARMDRTTDDISKGELKKLYGAISRDLYDAALKADGGSPGKAVAAWTRQNKYWSGRQDRVEEGLDKILGKKRDKSPEEVFLKTAPKNREQVTALRQVMRSLQPDERQVVSETIVARLGRAVPGQQTDVGDVFSTKTFLKNWNNLSDGARAQIIPDDATRTQLNNIARTANLIEESAATGQRFAGRFGSLSQVILAGMVGAGGYSGGIQGAAGVAGSAITGIRLTSNLLTNKKFVNWLAGATKGPVDPSAHFSRLAVIYSDADAETRGDIEGFVNSLNYSEEK